SARMRITARLCNHQRKSTPSWIGLVLANFGFDRLTPTQNFYGTSTPKFRSRFMELFIKAAFSRQSCRLDAAFQKWQRRSDENKKCISNDCRDHTDLR